jgi:hypothetical protein
MRRMSDLCGLSASRIEFNHDAWEVSMNQQSIMRTALFCQLSIGTSRNTIQRGCRRTKPGRCGKEENSTSWSLDVQFSFSAVHYRDGRVGGLFHDRTNDGLGVVDFDADVTCLAGARNLGRAGSAVSLSERQPLRRVSGEQCCFTYIYRNTI